MIHAVGNAKQRKKPYKYKAPKATPKKKKKAKKS